MITGKFNMKEHYGGIVVLILLLIFAAISSLLAFALIKDKTYLVTMVISLIPLIPLIIASKNVEKQYLIIDDDTVQMNVYTSPGMKKLEEYEFPLNYLKMASCKSLHDLPENTIFTQYSKLCKVLILTNKYGDEIHIYGLDNPIELTTYINNKLKKMGIQ